MDDFDFLVVGAGSAGAVVANRLASRYRVGLVEAGGRQASGQVRRPADFVKLFGSSNDWGWETAPQPGLANRCLRFPRGRGLGGSTRINASIWLEPRHDCWQRIAAFTGQRFSVSVLKDAYQSVHTLVAPETPRWLSESSHRFLQAVTQLQQTLSPDLVAEPFRRMNLRGVRRTAADMFVEPIDNQYLDASGDHHALPRHSLHTLTDFVVRRVLVEAGKAIGIECLRNGRALRITSARGVILCAGSIGSPCILQRSGIGSSKRLAELGIESTIALDGVGQGLKDHLIFPVIFNTPHTPPFPAAWSARQLARWQSVGAGPIASNLAEAGLHYHDAGRLIQLHVTPTDYLRHPTSPASSHQQMHPNQAAMTIGVTVADPQSSGQVHIVSSDPEQCPRIDPSYLSDELDLQAMMDAMEMVKRLVETEPLRSWLGSQLVPGRRDLRKCIERYSQTLYHPVGGCCVGTVVDQDFRLLECDRLWVMDASVLPFVPATNPNPLVMSLAWAFAASLL